MSKFVSPDRRSPMRAKLKYHTMAYGELFVMTDGVMKTLLLFVEC